LKDIAEIDINEVDARFNKYFEGLNQPKIDDAMLMDDNEPVMKKTTNLDGLDLELSQSTQ
jgi:hypothetical protein